MPVRLTSCLRRAASKEDASSGGRKAGSNFLADATTGAGSAAAPFTPAQITGASLSSGAVPALGTLPLHACKLEGC